MTRRLSRRELLRLTLAGGVGALAARYASNANPAAAFQVTPTPATPPLAPTATPEASTNPITPSASPASTSTAQATPTAALAANIARAAAQFLDSLDARARDQANFEFGDAERVRWHWTTPRGFPRNGLPLRQLTQEQRALALELLRVSVSEYGYQKALDIMSLQRDLGGDPELYYVSVFGVPGAADGWGWRWEGHHLSRHFTLVGDQVIMTPFFLGAWPTVNNAGLQAMAREENAARELVLSLEGPARELAIFQARTMTHHVTQNQPRVNPLDPVGLPAGELNAAQQQLMLEIIQNYTANLPTEIGLPLYERLQRAGIENVRFGWAGALEPRRPHYYRLQGPTFLLEFDNSRNSGTHIHSVWRDFEEDFGHHLA